jgi:hypothetical protein
VHLIRDAGWKIPMGKFLGLIVIEICVLRATEQCGVLIFITKKNLKKQIHYLK